MAHEIDQTSGRAAVFVAGQPAWHKLGTVIEDAATSAEAIALAGLDWRVEQWPVRAFDPDHPATEAGVAGAVANVRTDTKAVLGVVGRRYRVFQNREAFDVMDALVGDKLAMYETAGGLHGGRRVWMLARIPKEYRAGPDDLIKPYVLLTNTHDGSQTLRMIPTTIRVVCQNTLNLALNEAGVEGLSVSHHPRLESRVAEARTKLGIIAARFDKFDRELHAMLAKELSASEAEGYFRGMAGVDLPHASERQKNAREAVYGRMLADFDNERNTLAGVRHTAWGAYNAVSEWADHQKATRVSPGGCCPPRTRPSGWTRPAAPPASGRRSAPRGPWRRRRNPTSDAASPETLGLPEWPRRSHKSADHCPARTGKRRETSRMKRPRGSKPGHQ